MKLKRLLPVLICFVVLFSCFSFQSSANGVVKFDTYVNGEQCYGEVLLKAGENLTISIENVSLDDVAADKSDITYEWYKYNPAISGFEIINGANTSVFSETYDGTTKYECCVFVKSNSSSREILFKLDTLTVTGNSDCKIVYDNEMDQYFVYPGLVGAEGTVSVSAVSTINNANITYSWEKSSYFSYPTENKEFVSAGNTNSATFKLTGGSDYYWCTVNDGTTEKYVYFQIIPDETITLKHTANGKVPSMFAGTYIFVTKPNEKIVVDLTSTSKFGNVKYTWFKQNEDYSFSKLDITNGILETTKSEPPKDDPYATQAFECYIEDGNQLIRYQILFFCLDPETAFAEIEKVNKDTPDVSFATDNENLANTLLTGEELRNMTWGTLASVELSAELKDSVNESEKNVINAKLQDGDKIGMYLEMNLNKDIGGEILPITELNENIELSVDVPEALINNDDNVERNYQVIRMHNGQAEALDCQFDSETKTLNFETDKFSLYTITYNDTVPKKSESVQTPNPSQTPESSEKPISPLTGDNTHSNIWFVLLCISAIGFAGLCCKKLKV